MKNKLTRDELEEVRDDVLHAVRERPGMRCAGIVAEVKSWSSWSTLPGCLDRHVDRALQYHRRAGRIKYVRGRWKLVPRQGR